MDAGQAELKERQGKKETKGDLNWLVYHWVSPGWCLSVPLSSRSRDWWIKSCVHNSHRWLMVMRRQGEAVEKTTPLKIYLSSLGVYYQVDYLSSPEPIFTSPAEDSFSIPSASSVAWSKLTSKWRFLSIVVVAAGGGVRAAGDKHGAWFLSVSP